MPRIRQNITFGLELEATACSGTVFEIANRRNFVMRKDATILDAPGVKSAFGREIITPVLTAVVDSNQDGTDMSVDFGESPHVINDLCKCAAKVNTSCGVHVHLGRPDPKNPGRSRWQPESLRTFLVLGHSMEQHLFDVVPGSRQKNINCKTIGETYTLNELLSYYPIGVVDPNKRKNLKRYCWMNLIETQRVGTKNTPGLGEGPATGTVEVRLLGNTRRFNYIWAWTRFWVTLAAYVAYVPTSLVLARYTIGLNDMLSDVRAAKAAIDTDPEFSAQLLPPIIQNTN